MIQGRGLEVPVQLHSGRRGVNSGAGRVSDAGTRCF